MFQIEKNTRTAIGAQELGIIDCGNNPRYFLPVPIPYRCYDKKALRPCTIYHSMINLTRGADIRAAAKSEKQKAAIAFKSIGYNNGSNIILRVLWRT